MALSWNEIKDRAVKFSAEWAGTANEEADAKPFLIDFFNVFGISRKKVASFEHRVKKLDDRDGYIDLFWKGMMLVEMKSLGKNLDRAYAQAKEYLQKLKTHELPRYILISDFNILRLYDGEEDTVIEFTLDALVHHIQHFGFIAGYQRKVFKEQDPVNIKAAELMGRLHDRLEEIGYTGHPLEVYLVRMLFCLFAEDTTIFQRQQFQDYIEQRTAEDGADLAGKLSELFQVLNTPEDRRYKNLDEQLAAFPYVNGRLFEELLPSASFDAAMRTALLECCYLDWSRISPAIFGSMFQSVMNPKERRNLGAHYTSEQNILKLIRPLFLDELWKEFETVKGSKGRLADFHRRLSNLKFLDPACGCGNFLVITYRELRLLEIAVLRAMNATGQGFLDVREIIWLDVDAMYGIEYEEFPAQIAQVALWLMDHQMNMAISNEFGQYFVRLPLKKAATIVHGNALRTDWQCLLEEKVSNVVEADFFVRQKNPPSAGLADTAQPSKFDFILGNPPFIGSRLMNEVQRADIQLLFQGVDDAGLLDYVTGWYIKAAAYIQTNQTKVGFVSTNSIVQGEQVVILWRELMQRYYIHLSFAHQTFRWNNEAKGVASVYCVIIGFSKEEQNQNLLYEYDDVFSEPREKVVRSINPYLVEGKTVLIEKRTTPIYSVPKLIRGSIPYDDGNLLFSKEEMEYYLEQYPGLSKFIRRYGGARELIQNQWRYCFWLKDADPSEIKSEPVLVEKVNAVKAFRLASKGQSVKSKASIPTLFGDIRQPKGECYLLIPRHSSEKRKYIPIGFVTQETILADSAYGLPDATLYHFGILNSKMHMAWVKYTCGRIKSDFRYSANIVYNNFPWPENPSVKAVEAIELAAQGVLNARLTFPNNSLADLYDSVAMPPVLVKAHDGLDRIVDKAYGGLFASEPKRMEFLFELYRLKIASILQFRTFIK